MILIFTGPEDYDIMAESISDRLFFAGEVGFRVRVRVWVWG
jgi:hypothetical protein